MKCDINTIATNNLLPQPGIDWQGVLYPLTPTTTPIYNLSHPDTHDKVYISSNNALPPHYLHYNPIPHTDTLPTPSPHLTLHRRGWVPSPPPWDEGGSAAASGLHTQPPAGDECTGGDLHHRTDCTHHWHWAGCFLPSKAEKKGLWVIVSSNRIVVVVEVHSNISRVVVIIYTWFYSDRV